MKVTRAPSKKASLVGQGIGVWVGISVGVGKGGSVGTSNVGDGVVVLSIVAVEGPCEHETRQTINIPIHKHFIFVFNLAAIIFSPFSRLG
jgi:hypothetical protein